MNDGMSLNPYVFDFARALLAAAPTPPNEPAQEYEPVYLVSNWSRGYEQTSKEKFGRFEDQDRWLLYKKIGE